MHIKMPDLMNLPSVDGNKDKNERKEVEEMKIAYQYQDDKSSKFWTIDYEGLELCVHYGKKGTIGKYEIKEFDQEESCVKEADKLIRSKRNKGYHMDPDFDYNSCIYIDTSDYGPHSKTSHPFFVAHFMNDFYYDCGDEEAPFGSDEGADTLHILGEKLRKQSKLNFSAFPQHLIESEWGMNYIPVDTLIEAAVKEMARNQEMDMQQSDMVTYAAAFGQIKTTGKVNVDLKEAALRALRRFAIMYGDGVFTNTQRKMYDDLERFQINQ